MEPVPYKPNPMKYRYLLNNKYEQISSLQVRKPRSPTQTIEQPESKLGGAGEASIEPVPVKPAAS